MIEEVEAIQNTSEIVNISALRDIEQGILNYMLLSNHNFLKIKNELSEYDFTFNAHKKIFKYMVNLKEMCLSEIEVFAEILQRKNILKADLVLNILSQSPTVLSIDSNLELINALSMEKEIAIHNNIIKRSGTIETKDSTTSFDFINERIISIETTDLEKLPSELHDNFGDTLQAMELEDGKHKLNVDFYEDSKHPNDIESFYFTKDVSRLKWFFDLCKWADKYNLDEDIFPRDSYILQDLWELDISNKGINELPKEIANLTNLRILILDDNNIKEFPDELYQLKKLGLLSCMKNEISYVSEEIINLQELLMFAACHNDISLLPNNFFRLQNLTSFCLHGNKLTALSNEVGNLSNLTSITISNNDIAVLPQSISQLEYLESLDIENTQISEIPMAFLKHRSLNKLSINDDLLPFVAQNIQYLNIDTINLTASYIKASSEIIQELNFKIDTESWMEEKDKRDNGCVQLLKYKEKEIK